MDNDRVDVTQYKHSGFKWQLKQKKASTLDLFSLIQMSGNVEYISVGFRVKMIDHSCKALLKYDPISADWIDS